jgi:hypothetical protein
MTLNLTVLTSDRIYQSADFRLVLPETGELYDDATMKLVTLHYRLFDGFVTFTGIATEGSGQHLHTAQQIEQWLTGCIDIAFHEVVGIIRSKGSELVSRVAQREGSIRPLTFITAAFVKSKPVAAVISNSTGNVGSYGTDLHVTWYTLRPGNQPKLLVTGWSVAVTPESRSELLQLVADAQQDPIRIRIGMTETNRAAAQSQDAQGAISEGCTVVSMDRSGRGVQDVSVGSRLTVRSITNGTAVSLNEVLVNLGVENAIFKGSLFASSKPSPPPTTIVCAREIRDFTASAFEIAEINHVDNADCQVHDINADGLIVGMASTSRNRAEYHYWTWTRETGVVNLPHSTLRGGAAVNDGGAIALNIQTLDWKFQPLVWVDDVGTPLEVPEGMGEPSVVVMNLARQVGGSISINRDTTDRDREKPAVWQPDGSIMILRNLLGAESGRVSWINDGGLALVCGMTFPFGISTLIWDTKSNTVRRLPGEVIPLFIGSSGQLVGIETRPSGEQRPLVSPDGAVWCNVEMNDGFAPSASNDALALAGQVIIDGYSVGWLRRPNGKVELLPTYAYHQCNLRRMTNSNLILGQMWTEDHQHAVIWLPPK